MKNKVFQLTVLSLSFVGLVFLLSWLFPKCPLSLKIAGRSFVIFPRRLPPIPTLTPMVSPTPTPTPTPTPKPSPTVTPTPTPTPTPKPSPTVTPTPTATPKPTPTVTPTSTPSPTPTPISELTSSQRVYFLGDTGQGLPGQFAVANKLFDLHTLRPGKFSVILGDIIYWSGEQEKKASVFTLPFKKLFDLASDHQFRCVLGNHDFMTDKGQWYLKDSDFGFVGGNDFYVITDMAHVDFFMLNSNPDALWDKQRPWLENALKQSQKPWKVACGHHPLFSSGRYGDSPFLQGKCQDLFQKYKVQFYFNGHDHAYERTKMIKGTIYITAGMSGASLYEENKPNQNTTVRIINQFGLLESVWEKDWCWFTFRSPYDSSRDVDTVKMNLSDFA